MKRVCIAAMCLSLLLPASALAQSPQPTTKLLSKEAAITGVIAMFAGGVLMSPVGDTVSVDRNAYCVQEYSITTGGCAVSDTRRKIGMWTLVGGAALTVIGLQHVKVAPTLNGRGADVTVVWGGK